jgi:V8-like Glu-specific endopeptidase
VRLTGDEFAQLQDALVEAFVDYGDLDLALGRVGKRIGDVAAPGPLPQVVGKLIRFAETRDWLHELIAAARAANPENVELAEVAASVGLEPGGPTPGSPGEGALAGVTARFERLVDPERGIADLGSYVAKIQELVRRVCAVEVGEGAGTGFLIGPRTVLTNYHVVERVISGEVPSSSIVLRFDYQRLRDGHTVNGGSTFSLADSWLVHAEPYSELDEQAYDPTRTPADHELDFAVLRCRDPLGSMDGPARVERGWIEPRAQPYDFPAGSFLMVVQHPCKDPISYDAVDDGVLRTNGNGTRVHYRANTMPGSSGSPVLDRRLELVALHHAGEPGSPDFGLPCHKQVSQATYNEGIPIAKVQQRLAERGFAWVFGGEEP